jgi:hypothetical protein
VSSLVRVTVTPVPGPSPALFVTVTNGSKVHIPGPVLIVFTNLPRPVGLGSANSSTVAAPLFVAPDLPGLAPGQSGTALVSFPGLLSLPSHGITAEVLAELPPSLSLPPHLDATRGPATAAGGVAPRSPFGLDSLFGGWAPDQLASRPALGVP